MQTGSPPTGMPIMNMSYGANACSGLKNVKGNPALIVESNALGAGGLG